MIFGKFTIQVDQKHLEGIPSGMFVGHSVIVGKVFLGNFRKKFTAKSVDADKYKSAYNAGDKSRSHEKLDAHARQCAMTEHTMRSIVPQYVTIRAYWTGVNWKFAEPKDIDISTNGDGIRLSAKIIEQVADPFAW